MITFITRPAEMVDLSLLKNDMIKSLPMMRYVDLPLMHQDVNAYQHLIFTSQYATQRYLQSGFDHKTTYCVGKETAKQIDGIYPHQTGVNYLIDLICDIHKKSEPLLYLCGEIIKYPLDKHLQDLGYYCQKKVIYKTEPIVQDLSILQDDFCVVFYSRQTYIYFMDMVHAQNLHSILKKAIALFVNPNPTTSIFLCKDTIHWKEVISLKDTQDVLSYIQGESS